MTTTVPTHGGPAVPASIVTDGKTMGRVATRVYGYTSAAEAAAAGYKCEAGPASSVYVVSAAELASGKFIAEGDPKALPMYAAPVGMKVEAGYAQPIIIVGGALSSSTPTITPLRLQSNANGTITLIWAFSAGGGPMTVDWGDGTTPTSHATTLSHTYSSGATKTVSLTCPDWTKVTTLNFSTFGTAYAFRLAQAFPDLSALTNLQVINFDAQFFSDVPATLANNTKLTSFSMQLGAVTSVSTLAFTTQKSLAAAKLSFDFATSSAPVDNFLASLVTSLGISGRVACTVTTSGMYFNGPTKSLASDTGAASAATLIAAGWTCNGIAHPWLSVVGDSISATNPTWLTTVNAAWNGGSGVGKNALRDWAVASQGILSGNVLLNYPFQVSQVFNSQMIFVFMGVNDNNAGNMATLQSTFETGIVNLKAQNPGVVIYNIGVLPCWTDGASGPELDKSNIRAAIIAGCAAQSITYWDTYTSPIILQSDTTDGVHLKASGQTKLANFVKTQLGI